MTNSGQLAFENQQVLALVQAMLCAISPNMRAVSVQFVGRSIHLHFVLEHENASDREEIGSITTEFEALQERGVEVEVHVSVSAEVWPYGTSSLGTVENQAQRLGGL